MDTKRPSSPRETFIIRLWQRDSDRTDWLGQIQQVSNGETAVIHNLDALTDAVKKLLPPPPAPESKLK